MTRFPVSGNGFASDTERERVAVGDLPASAAGNVLTGTGTGSAFKHPHGYNAKHDYGLVGDGVTDDLTAFNAMIADLRTKKGGWVYFPDGTYILTGEALGDGLHGVTFVGSGHGNGQGYQPKARLKFTLTGSGRALSLRSSGNLRFINLGIVYGSGSFTGDLIDISHDGVTNQDSQDIVFDQSLIYSVSSTSTSDTGAPITSAHSAIKLSNAINVTFRSTKIGGAQYGCYGQPSNASGYCNTITWEGRCEFDTCAISFLANCGQSWVLRDPVFEMLNFGNGGTPHVYTSDVANPANPIGGDLQIHNAWYGDLSADTVEAIKPSAGDSFSPLVIDGGNWFGGTATQFDLTAGMVRGGRIVDNVPMGGANTVIELGDTGAGAASKAGLRIQGNYFGSATTPIGHPKGHYLLGTQCNEGQNASFDDIVQFTNPRFFLGRAGPTNASPSIVAETGAGSTGSADVRRGADCFNVVEVTPGGTGIAAGALCSITLVNSLANSLPGSTPDAYAACAVFPLNDAAYAAGVYHNIDYAFFSDSAYALAKLRFNCHNAPTSGQTIRFGYLAMV